MKVCQFCGAENPDSATVCSSCGANEFKVKCGNCGTLFSGGNFCPKCGVKAGSKAKKCPRCGQEYYSAACPDCGFTYSKAQADHYSNRPTNSSQANPYQQGRVYKPNSYQQPKARDKTWLWVLGWIFIFPVPLTLLLQSKRGLSKRKKVALIALGWVAYVILLIVGNTNS